MAATKFETSLTRRKLLTGLGASGALGAAFVARPDMAIAGAQTLAEYCGLVTPGQANIGTASHATPDGGATPDGSFRSWNDPAAWPDGKVPGPHDKAVVTKHIVASGDVTVGGIEIRQGGLLRYEPNTPTTIQSRGNVVVAGCLTMRPSSHAVVHTLRFIEVDESKYVGGGMDVLDSDVGLWVVGDGVLDAVGAQRTAWSRRGDDPTWLPTDELIVAPNAPGDFTSFAPFRKGAAVPTVAGPGGATHATEVANLSRNVWIEGTAGGRAHIMFLHCHKPQTIKHIGVMYMGPRQNTSETVRGNSGTRFLTEAVLGRYGLHFHHCGDGTRGSLVEGVVVRNGGGNAFVPHESHGITLRDCVAYEVYDNGFWWDLGHVSHDTRLEHCAALMIRTDPDFRGYGTSGFTMGEGLNNTASDCVAVGVRSGGVNAGGFLWSAAANHKKHNVWAFTDCVAHNNREIGFATWQNDVNDHLIERIVSYHNRTGISHGAYQNRYHYRDSVSFGNDYELAHRAVGPITFERMTFDGDVRIGPHALESHEECRYLDCRITGKIVIDEGDEKPGIFHFVSSAKEFDLGPERFEVLRRLSTVKVTNSDGRSFVVG